VSALFLVGIVAFVVLLLVSVMIHEWGHFTAARKFGMKATDFFVGFGTTLWSTKRGETEYGIKAIPAGGFVKIVGMTELEEIDPEDEPRAFYKQPAHRRAVVLGAGSFMHFVIAGVLLLIIPLAFASDVKTTTAIASISSCTPDQVDGHCSQPDLPSPAGKAGLQPGDTILAVNGTDVADWDSAQAAIRAAGPGPAQITYEREGVQSTVTVDLASGVRPDLDDPNKTVTVGILGMSPGLEAVRVGPIGAVKYAGETYWQMVSGSVTAMVSIPSKIPALWDSTVHDTPRDPNGPVGAIGAAHASGQILGSDGDPLAWRVAILLLLIAGLNIFIGLFNLLPILPLDGGHLAVLGYEQARSKVARWRGRPDPGRVDMNKMLPVAYVFLFAIITLSVLLLVADVINPIDLGL
jgi:membrane-associated protease RseP (regulator of RpoE activity)